MNRDLNDLILQRLDSDGLRQNPFATLVFAACEGPQALRAALEGSTAPSSVPSSAVATKNASGSYLTSVTVQGFRGIGPRQTLAFNPGPGLTLIVGRNGSGKSSFAEALEVLFTGDSKRWSNRPKIWKEGWRNLHQPHPTTIEAEVMLEGQGPATIASNWEDGAPLESCTTVVQPRGKKKTTLDALGWAQALESYRPFLSYNELGSLLDEGPSKLYDALSLVLGLEELVNAQAELSKARLERQRGLTAADEQREEFIELLAVMLEHEHDDRALACRDALSSKDWGIDDVEKILSLGTAPQADKDTGALTRAAAMESADADRVRATVAALRAADVKMRAAAGSDAERARQQASLLEAALRFYAVHGDGDCPVCGTSAALTGDWAKSARNEIDRLRSEAAGSEAAHRAAEAALRSARELLAAPPKLLDQLFEIGVDGLAALRVAWHAWHAGAAITDLPAIAGHIEEHSESLQIAIERVRDAAARELRRREDRWRPMAMALSEWIAPAREARRGAENIPRLKQAENWLKEAASDIRNERFSPIAEQAMAAWKHLRQQSNVELGRIELVGAKQQRRVALDVTVDGVAGAALGVMSQGELHALALSLFLPRVTLPESPFRFIVIDDPVQSMDPSRVDGLARALETTAKSRQVIVFTHDERLPEAVRRLGIAATILGVTRRPKSVVEIRTALDPVRANIEDALALVHTTQLPREVLSRLVPGFCRAALEASFIHAFRRRRLSAGHSHSEVEEELRDAAKLTPLAALALFDDKTRGGDVMRRLNQFGPWAGDVYKQCKDGVHETVASDLQELIRQTERLSEKIAELRS